MKNHVLITTYPSVFVKVSGSFLLCLLLLAFSQLGFIPADHSIQFPPIPASSSVTPISNMSYTQGPAL